MATYPTIGVGDLVTADLLTSMLPQSYYKTAATARLSTTTYANDPDLTGIPLVAGTYDIEAFIFCTATGVDQVIKTQWAFTGTWTTAVRNCTGPGSTNTATSDVATPGSWRGWATDTQSALYGLDASSAYNSIRETVRGLVVTADGSLSLSWAPNASTPNNLTVQPGSAFHVKRTA